jgi:hypothetical protein
MGDYTFEAEQHGVIIAVADMNGDHWPDNIMTAEVAGRLC